jgi:hypothetical protein
VLWTDCPSWIGDFTRRAFEDWLEEICASWSSSVVSDRPPTTASKLVAVGALHGVELRERVMSLWHNMSQCLHHHAYELQPAEGEVRKMVTGVRQLVALLGGDAPVVERVFIL